MIPVCVFAVIMGVYVPFITWYLAWSFLSGVLIYATHIVSVAGLVLVWETYVGPVFHDDNE